MSDGAGVRGILLGHGGMPEGMVDAVRHITGCDREALTAVSNRGMSPDALAAEVRNLAGDDPTILFTDLSSGSCGFVAHRLTHTVPGMVVVSGVNLPLLIDFVMNRERPLEELVPRLLARGRAAMGCAPAHFEDDDGTPVSGR
jgi:mannose PTS system EIIA component